MKQINAFVFAHPYFTSYLFVYGLLQIGLIATTGFDYAPALFFLFLLPFVLFYFGLNAKFHFLNHVVVLWLIKQVS